MEKTLDKEFASRKLLSNKQACAITGLSDKTLYTKRVAGELAHIKFGNLIRYRIEDLEAFMSRCTVPAKNEALAGAN